MANPAAALKRVPKWAWFVAAGVGVGGIALNRRRAAKEDAEAAVTGTDPATGQATGTAPPGVIVPPVIMGGGNEAATLDPGIVSIYGGLTDLLSGGFNSVLGTAASLAWQPDQIIQLTAGAGPAPNPVAQEPTVINVTPPQPAPTPAPTPGTPASRCPSSHPNGTYPHCFNNCGWDDCRSGKVFRVHGHCYNDGSGKVITGSENTGRKC